MLTLDDTAEFYWAWNHRWFLKTDKGNFVWSDSEYPGGDDTIKPYQGNLEQFCKEEKLDFCRWKGKKIISQYCGKDVKILAGGDENA